MKKNVKCNLLKSLFLTGTVLTVSACNKGDEKISSMNNELKSLKQEMEKKISEMEAKQLSKVKEHDENLIKNIDESIKKLETIKDADFFLDELNNIKNSLNQIDNENDKKEIIKKIKDNDKIKFHFEKDFNGNVNFSCGKVLFKNISSNYENFVYYCYLARKLIDLVGLEDKYKIDVSHIKEWNNDYVEFLRSLPEKYFAKKVFYFDVDNDKNIVAGWGKAKKVKSLDIEKIIKNFIYICYLNSDFLDPGFNFQDFVFTDIEHRQNFDFGYNVEF